MAATYDAARGVLRMTMEDWKKLHKDYKGTSRDANGTLSRSALHLVPGQGTSIVPVEIIRTMTLREKSLHEAATVPGFDPARDGAFAQHRAADPHCTCNDCLAHHEAQTTED